ncbi:MAG: TIGR02186 family protein [Micavibrio sp.]|nr:TIGR02186 family protein [Micavibrio sp.]
MMRVVLVFAMLMMLWPLAAQAENPLEIDLAKNTVDITTGFTGADVVVFGVKNGRGDIAIVLEGPRKAVTVRRKENVFGAWINRSWINYDDMPLYYDYAIGSLDDTAYKKVGIGVEAIEFKAGKKGEHNIDEHKLFKSALIDEKVQLAFYSVTPTLIEFLDGGFFKVLFHLPANVPKGDYVMRAYLIEKGKVTFTAEKMLYVGQVGFNAKVLSFSYNERMLYALLCIAIAFAAGWVSNKLARRS